MPKGAGIVAQINAPRDLEVIARKLKEAGRGDLRRKLGSEIRAAAKVAANDAKQAALALPSQGEDSNALRASLAKSVRVSTSYAGSRVGVRIQSMKSVMPDRAKNMAKATNKGKWRHPVFQSGSQDRKSATWVSQTMPGHWFDDAMSHSQVRIRAAVWRVIERYKKEIV